MKYSLRDYQQDAVNQLYTNINNGIRKNLIWLPTGTGKGMLMSYLADSVLSVNKPVQTIMRRRSLIEQTRDNYIKYHGHNPSIIMGNHKGYRHKAINQVCSIDTIRTRMLLDDYQYLAKDQCLIEVDECHDTGSPTYQSYFEWIEKNSPDVNFVGFTATPFTISGKPLDFWEAVISPITMAQVRDRGWLSPDLHLAPVTQISTLGLKIEQGDFKEKDLFDRASESVIIGDIVNTWIKHGDNRPTIMFCVNKEHSKMMTAAFNMKGIPCVHVDESTTLTEREQIKRDLYSGKYKIISNIETMTTGFDAPIISCVIHARPTWSEVLYIQSLGRAARPYKVCADCGFEYGAESACIRCKSTITSFNKENFIILDHAANVERHGFFYDERKAKLKKLMNINEQKKFTRTGGRSSAAVVVTRCEKDFMYVKPGQPCPVCGEVKVNIELPKEQKGELSLIDEATAKKLRLNQILSQYEFLAKKAVAENWGRGKIYFVLHKKFGDLLLEYTQELSIPSWVVDKINEQKESKAAKK